MRKAPPRRAEGLQWECLRCGHQWNSQDGGKPTACARCSSAYWDRPRKYSARKLKPRSAGLTTVVESLREKALGILPPPGGLR